MRDVIITKLRYAASTSLIPQNSHISHYAASTQMLWFENSNQDSKYSDKGVSRDDSNNRNNVSYENDTFVCMGFFYKYRLKLLIARFLFQCSFYLRFAVKLFVILSFLCYLLRVSRICCRPCQTMAVLLRSLKTLVQQCWEMLIFISKLLLNTDDSPVVSNNTVRNYNLFSLLDILFKSLANLLESLGTLLSSKSVNVLSFSLLEIKYGLVVKPCPAKIE